MICPLQIQVLPEVAGIDSELKRVVAQQLSIEKKDISDIHIKRRSVDARQKQVKINLTLDVYVGERYQPESVSVPDYPNVRDAEEVIIIGAGPAGLFAALTCIQSGKKPVILERGKDVRARIKDLKNLNVHHIVNEDSNYCFGEGGAGTYSDGKLYTRSKKRGNVSEILNLLVGFGANPNILVEAHPHIGTNKLPGIIANIRQYIQSQGGEIHFNTRVTEFVLEGSHIKGVKTLRGTSFQARKLILATGHSARDIFEYLYHAGIEIEAKPIALGVRVEHPQSLIDSIQYHCEHRGPYLPPAPYSVVKQVDGRGVYSFCMCPGGVVAACATQPGEIVTNGWSGSQRSRPTANSGIVVEVRPEDIPGFEANDPLAFMKFQQSVEQKAWELGGKSQVAPAQLLADFIEHKVSATLPKTSYSPGITSVELGEVLPGFIHKALRDGFKQFNLSMKGYVTNEAVVHATESRTSSPVRIPRDPKTLEHIRIQGLYPCGEGAGYAGGIISAAVDGVRCAQAVCTSR
ncbi:MAG: FAD-dependent protein [Bacteroidota bacterium]